ncbi:MAG: thioredoxin family protein [Bacteroidia bacterium]|nr:thioredoxin family protein [Bacteroidia bacterium]
MTIRTTSRSLALTGLLMWAASSFAQAPETIRWVSIEEAASLSAQDGKKILVDLYTDWCGWCKKMDKDTYAQERVAKYINTHYHAVKFNAEQHAEVMLGGTTFKYLANGSRGVHELALRLTNGRPSYPTTVFLDAGLGLITSVPGYQNADGMLPILAFLAEDAYKTTSWEAYQRSWQPR